MKRRDSDTEYRGLEFFVTLMLSIHHISIFVTAILRDWDNWILLVVAIALVCTWFLTFTQYRSLRFRAICSAIFMHISIGVFSVYSDNLIYVLLPFITVCVLMGLYGIVEVIWVDVLAIAGLIIYHLFFAKTISFQTTEDIYAFSIPIVNTIFTLYVLFSWMKHRDAATKKTTQLISELKRAEAIKDDFLSNVSHELRTPINTINGMSDVALNETDPAKLREQLHAIEYAGRNLMSVVSDILDFSELQSGKIEILEESYNIQSTINDVIQMAYALKKDKRIDFFVDCDATLPSGLIGDEKKIRRVIMNLISNAFKFTTTGGVMLTVRYRKELYGMNLIVEVKDTGIGMDAKSLDQLFTSFCQADMSRTKKIGGMGLGLSIAQIIVQSMGGVITVKSKPEKGTTMTVVIPQKIENEVPIVQLENNGQYHLLVYMNLELVANGLVRDFCIDTWEHIKNQLNISENMCKNYAELKRRVQSSSFTHVIIGTEEYLADPDYFDTLAKQVSLVILMDYMDEVKISNPDLIRLYKPFSVLSLACVLNGKIQKGMQVHYERRISFEAPDARVLVVDDNIMNLRVVEGLLLKYKIQVSSALSGKEAIALVRQYKYDLIFMDHMMPEMDGIETFHAIRQIGNVYCKHVPVIALTANAISGAREQFIQIGFADFIEKPVESSVLERVLMRTLLADKIHEITDDESATIMTEHNLTVRQHEETREEAQQQESEQEKYGLPGFQVELGMRYCGGEEGYFEILTEYAKKGDEDIKKIDSFYRKEDWKNYTILVHAIKSSMLSIGAVNLSEQAKALEKAGKANDIAYIRANHEAMTEEYKNVLDAILHCPRVTLPAALEQTDLQEISEEQFLSIIRGMEDIMFDFDENAMLLLLQPLYEGCYKGTPLSGHIEKVRYKIRMSDFLSAVDTLKQTKEQLDHM